MNIKITKLSEAPNPHKPNHIETGYSRTGQFNKSPKVGERFYVGGDRLTNLWSTSAVQRIIDDNTFETYNSVYRWEFLPEKV